ncbi:hypothetical protein DPMN_128098 [Dreissena polymorpha]|uniref:Ig-like domain-containing protein n=1 Tax=Dreissena polymorpha TaxID=45954 RepID=A0A9D4H6I2_DREPO|nr:hypothetical protein DPMN_128098 [Dreissena polymorpha]
MRIYLIWICVIWDGPNETNAQNTTLSLPSAFLGFQLSMSCEFTEATLGFTWVRSSNSTAFFTSVGSIYNVFSGSQCVPPDPELAPNPSLYSFSCPSTSRQTLTIKNVTLGNHGERWQCGAFPLSGGRSYSNYVILSILVHISKLEMSPNVDPVSLIVNQSAQFTCTSDFGRPTPFVYWFIDDKTNKESIINITTLSVITTLSENATISTLAFMPSKTYHNMRLYCSGNNGGPTVSSSLKPLLNILFGPTQHEFNYNGSMVAGSLAVLSGMSFLLTCKSSGNPPPAFTWTYPGGTATGENLVISRKGSTTRR